MRFQVNVFQLDVKFGNPSGNFDHFLNLYRQQFADSSENIPQLIVLPELWLTGYDFNRIRSTGQADFEDTMVRLADFARHSHSYFLAGSIAEISEGSFYNTSYLFDPQGEIIGKYRKQKLFPLMDEQSVFKPGETSSVFETPLGKIGVLVCYDLRFPELAREMTGQGAEILIFPSEFPDPRLAHFKTLLLARAIENQCFVIAANCSSADPALSFCGHSLIIDPWGEILAEAGTGEEIISETIDLELVCEVRRKIPVFNLNNSGIIKERG